MGENIKGFSALRQDAFLIPRNPNASRTDSLHHVENLILDIHQDIAW
tara:strand:- start:17704 stop:17844 length:141 start_codon:yes stop_codon:yes gene_type:complete